MDCICAADRDGVSGLCSLLTRSGETGNSGMAGVLGSLNSVGGVSIAAGCENREEFSMCVRSKWSRLGSFCCGRDVGVVVVVVVQSCRRRSCTALWSRSSARARRPSNIPRAWLGDRNAGPSLHGGAVAGEGAGEPGRSAARRRTLPSLQMPHTVDPHTGTARKCASAGQRVPGNGRKSGSTKTTTGRYTSTVTAETCVSASFKHECIESMLYDGRACLPSNFYIFFSPCACPHSSTQVCALRDQRDTEASTA